MEVIEVHPEPSAATALTGLSIEPKEEKKLEACALAHQRQFSFPRISTFFGEKDKGEASYLQWRYEVRCLIFENQYTEQEILFGVRRSCKGEAANILRRLGTKTDLEKVMSHFESMAR